MNKVWPLVLLLFVGCGEVQPPPPPAPPPTPLKDFVILPTSDDNVDKLNAWLHEHQGEKQIVGCTFITHRPNTTNLTIVEMLLHVTKGVGKFQRFVKVNGDAHALQDYLDQNPCKVICIAADPMHTDVFLICIEEK